jgi:hypothetical protein
MPLWRFRSQTTHSAPCRDQVHECEYSHGNIEHAFRAAAIDVCARGKPARFVPELVEHQTQIILDNLSLILKSEGLSRSDVVSCHLYVVTRKRLIERIDRIYQRYFANGETPLRTELGISELPRGALVAMEFMASTPMKESVSELLGGEKSEDLEQEA